MENGWSYCILLLCRELNHHLCWFIPSIIADDSSLLHVCYFFGGQWALEVWRRFLAWREKMAVICCHTVRNVGFKIRPWVRSLLWKNLPKNWSHFDDVMMSINHDQLFFLLWGWFQSHSVWCVLSKFCSFLLQGGAPVSEVGFRSWTIFYGHLWVLELFRTMFTWILPSGKLT